MEVLGSKKISIPIDCGICHTPCDELREAWAPLMRNYLQHEQQHLYGKCLSMSSSGIQNDAREVKPIAILSNTKDRYCGLALTSIPMKDIYDFEKRASIVAQGKFTIASTKAKCVRSSWETTCDSAARLNRSCIVVVTTWEFGDWLEENNWTSSSKGVLFPY